MTKIVAALTGISGVGKSTLVEKLSSIVPLTHLQASALIKAGRSTISATEFDHDQLRHLDIDENQQLLTRGFLMATSAATGLIVLDSHTVIEGAEGLTAVAANVFGAISTESMIFVVDEPSVIDQRRRSDLARRRPTPSTADLQFIQKQAQDQAESICRRLEIPLFVFSSNEHSKIAQVLRSRLANMQ